MYLHTMLNRVYRPFDCEEDSRLSLLVQNHPNNLFPQRVSVQQGAEFNELQAINYQKIDGIGEARGLPKDSGNLIYLFAATSAS